MKQDRLEICISTIDEKRFGIKTARAVNVTSETLPEVVNFCRHNKIVFLIARCNVEEVHVAQVMENSGFILTDTLLYYTHNFHHTPIHEDSREILVRPMRSGEELDVQQIARKAFHGYGGHYHADPRLDRPACDEVYSSWAYNSCLSRDAIHEVLVAVFDSRLVGFLVLRLNNPQEGEGVLNGVAPHVQGQGIYRTMLLHGINWCLSNKAERMIISTQITNINAQKVWVRMGFELNHAFYTFHKWFDEDVRL